MEGQKGSELYVISTYRLRLTIAKGHAACVSCHQRKIRCDARQRGLPCSNCISSRRPNCQIHEKKRRNLTRARPGPQGQQGLASVTILSSTTNALPLHKKGPVITEAASPILSIPDSDHHGSETTSDSRNYRRHLIELIDQDDIGRRPIKNGVRITYVGKDVSNLNFLIRQRHGGDNETMHHFPSNLLAQRFITHESESARDAFILPERAIADELVDAYFRHVNPGCPIIDEKQFMQQYRGRDPNAAPSLLVLQSILLVGAHVSRQSPEREEMKAIFFRRAKLIFDARLERNRDVVVQAALLLTWHSDGEEDIGANAWFWVGIAARTALGLGMHRDIGSSTFIPLEKRIWRRTWWILVQFDVVISLSYGRPQAT
jgi:transcriptional regulatory protein AMDR